MCPFNRIEPFLTFFSSTWIYFLAVPKGTSFGVYSPFFVRFSFGNPTVACLDTCSGREYIQLTLLVIVKVVSSLMAPIGMNQLLQCVSLICCLRGYLGRVSLGTSKRVGRALSSAHGSGLHIFS
jgi:hypothetical protein